eukprot:gene60117-80175_t
MLTAKTLLKASLGLCSFLKAPMVEAQPRATSAPQPVMVPIRSIGPRERERIARHLLELTPHDRYLRFGYAAADEQVQRYVDSLDFERDELFGIYNRRLDLIAMAHLAFAPGDQHSDCAEFGVSVSAHARGRGYGARLFERGRGGYALTPAGEEMVALAARMNDEITTFERRIAGRDVKPSGELRITINDTMMAHLMTPVFSSFLKACPDVRLDIVVTNAALNLSKRDADIAIRATAA